MYIERKKKETEEKHIGLSHSFGSGEIMSFLSSLILCDDDDVEIDM